MEKLRYWWHGLTCFCSYVITFSTGTVYVIYFELAYRRWLWCYDVWYVAVIVSHVYRRPCSVGRVPRCPCALVCWRHSSMWSQFAVVCTDLVPVCMRTLSTVIDVVDSVTAQRWQDRSILWCASVRWQSQLIASFSECALAMIIIILTIIIIYLPKV